MTRRSLNELYGVTQGLLINASMLMQVNFTLNVSRTSEHSHSDIFSYAIVFLNKKQHLPSSRYTHEGGISVKQLISL